MTTVNSDKQFLFILSRKAGDGRSANFRDLIEKTFREYGMLDQVEVKTTAHATHTTNFAREFAVKYGDQGIVFAVGGDGSVNEVASAICGTGCAMGVIPAGTGNDFARTLYGRETPAIEDLIHGLLRAVNKKMDMIRIRMEGCHPPNERGLANRDMYLEDFDAYCLNVLSFGLDTVVLDSAMNLLERHPRLKGMSYFLGVVANLIGKKKFPVRYSLNLADGTVLEGENADCVLGAICNGGYYGNGFNPAPMARPDDGLLHLTVADWMGGMNFLKLILKYHKGEHVGHKDIHITDITGGTFASATDAKLMGNYDGIIFEADRFSFEVLPQALPFVIPQL